MPIVSHLGSKEPSLLGESPVEKALVRQWVTFQVGGEIILFKRNVIKERLDECTMYIVHCTYKT